MPFVKFLEKHIENPTVITWPKIKKFKSRLRSFLHSLSKQNLKYNTNDSKHSSKWWTKEALENENHAR